MRKILPGVIADATDKLIPQKLYEIRLRSCRPVTVNYGGTYAYLTSRGISSSSGDAFRTSVENLRQVVVRACDKSLYAVNDNICKGFLTVDGIRIGLAGEAVTDGSAILTIKNFTGLNIRIPHEVRGCAEKVLRSAECDHGYKSTLLISPPGAGKTTMLRDMARLASDAYPIHNVLLCDERNEIAAVSDGKAALDVGANTDVFAGAPKDFAFTSAIRALRPDIIVTDELCGEADLRAVESAIAGGVSVFATIHADSHMQLKQRESFRSVLQNRCFERFVDLSSSRGVGTVEGIYDENFAPLAWST